MWSIRQTFVFSQNISVFCILEIYYINTNISKRKTLQLKYNNCKILGFFKTSQSNFRNSLCKHYSLRSAEISYLNFNKNNFRYMSPYLFLLLIPSCNHSKYDWSIVAFLSKRHLQNDIMFFENTTTHFAN